MDLIDREELLKDWNKKLNRLIPDEDGLHPISLETVIKALKTAPTVDAEPVRHGKWLFLSYLDSMERKCSECGDYIFLVNELEYNYCPHCGAKMKGE